MKQISEPKNPNELWCGECKIAGVFTEAQKKQSGGLVPLSLDQKWSTKRST
jgi:biotin-(acetyl-CoA carboxylase) ligase